MDDAAAGKGARLPSTTGGGCGRMSYKRNESAEDVVGAAEGGDAVRIACGGAPEGAVGACVAGAPVLDGGRDMA